MPPDLLLRHARVMFERQRGDTLAVAAATDAGKAHDRADLGAPLREQRALARDVEIGLLDTDCHAGHGGVALRALQRDGVASKSHCALCSCLRTILPPARSAFVARENRCTACANAALRLRIMP